MSWNSFKVLGVAVLIAGLSGTANAYVLEFVSYDGLASASASGGSYSDSDSGPFYAHASAVDPIMMADGQGTASIGDLTGGGGTGEGTYPIANVSTQATSNFGSGSASALGTYTWRLLSEYDNSGVVTLALLSSGGFTYGGTCSMTVTSSVDSWVSDPSLYVTGWQDEVSFDVVIGETFTVGFSADATAGGEGYESESAACDASLAVPVEVPEPATLALLAGGLLLVRRRR
ncbi:MAG: PEP-CTERM sorting domain-containing protein [Phycisphaerae bacterium]|nr:PEP-CTERM sorting domain-containing protein [Phycisphaerae bacterium]